MKKISSKMKKSYIVRTTIGAITAYIILILAYYAVRFLCSM